MFCIKLNNIYLEYFRLVGYNLGVNRKSVLNDFVMDIFFVNVVIIESKISVLFLFVKEMNILE